MWRERNRKYQWVCMPLSLIGVVYTTAGEKIDIALGENPNDPVLFINDLLPHLAKDQSEKKLSEAIQGEMLMPMLGCNSTEEKTKPAILTLLKEKYGIESTEAGVKPSNKLGISLSIFSK